MNAKSKSLLMWVLLLGLLYWGWQKYQAKKG